MRELFIYYRIPVAKADEARAAVHAFQARLRARHMGLSARLLCRHEIEDSLQTWMEIYAFDPMLNASGITAACQSDIESEARCLDDLIAGARHTEGFVPCVS
jgi:hypothetical protein